MEVITENTEVAAQTVASMRRIAVKYTQHSRQRLYCPHIPESIEPEAPGETRLS
jgi:hypothetical protein